MVRLFPTLRERRRQLAQSRSAATRDDAIARALMAKPRFCCGSMSRRLTGPLVVDQSSSNRQAAAALGRAARSAGGQNAASVVVALSDRATYHRDTGRITMSGGAARTAVHDIIQFKPPISAAATTTPQLDGRAIGRARRRRSLIVLTSGRN